MKTNDLESQKTAVNMARFLATLSQATGNDLAPFPEGHEVYKMVHAIADKAGLTPVPDVVADFLANPRNAMSTVNADKSKAGIFVNPYWSYIVPKEWQMGVLAHEMGHAALKHPAAKAEFLKDYPDKDLSGNNFTSMEEVADAISPEKRKALQKFLQRQELAADAWATQQGYGDSLALSLGHDLPEELGLGRIFTEASLTHPSIKSRVRRIRKLMKAMEVPQEVAA